MFSGYITVEVGVPKLGNCLEMYTCAQCVHSMCTNLDTPCTLELLPGHPCVCKCIHAWGMAWANVYISKQFPSLGIPTFTAMLVKAIVAAVNTHPFFC